MPFLPPNYNSVKALKGYSISDMLLGHGNFPTFATADPRHVGLRAGDQGGYIFYAGGSLAGTGYCRQSRRRPAILLLQLWQGCQACVKISAQRPPRVAQFNAH